MKAPDRPELEVLVQRISARVGRCLERLGLLVRDAENAWLDMQPPADDDAITQLLGSSVTYRIAVGPQQGSKAFVLRTLPPLDGAHNSNERVAKVAGFSLHAGVSCAADQRDKRERLCRYIARPPVSVQRLSLSPHGKVVYTLKTRCHGVLAPSHHWRAEITPAGRGKGARGRHNRETESPIERHAAMTCTRRA